MLTCATICDVRASAGTGRLFRWIGWRRSTAWSEETRSMTATTTLEGLQPQDSLWKTTSFTTASAVRTVDLRSHYQWLIFMAWLSVLIAHAWLHDDGADDNVMLFFLLLKPQNDCQKWTKKGIHVSYDIIPGFLEGSLGMHGITLRNNTFRSVHGCPGNPHADANGCPNVCTGMPCILQHVDPALRGILSLENNVVAKT